MAVLDIVEREISLISGSIGEQTAGITGYTVLEKISLRN